MNTDDLSQEAYKAVMIEAELFKHNLTLRFGLLSYDCEDEEQFLNKSIKLATSLKKVSKNAANRSVYASQSLQINVKPTVN